MKREGFPFSALVGLERVKRACLLCLVNPACGGLLVSGGSGTGKSVALRSAASLTEDPWVEVPLNIDEDRLFGALDMKRLCGAGKGVFLRDFWRKPGEASCIWTMSICSAAI